MKQFARFLILTIFGLVFFGCGDDDFEAPTDEPNVILINTSFGIGEPIVQINGTETFADLSTGVNARQWSFPGGDISDVTSSSDKSVVVKFSKIGEYEVKLNQTFNGIPWDWQTKKTKSSNVLDTTITVTVVDSVKADIEVWYVSTTDEDSIKFDMTDGALNVLMAGDKIRIKNSSVGAPTILTTFSDGASPTTVQRTQGSEDFSQDIEIKYQRTGDYDFNFSASRVKPQGADEIDIDNFIRVIPSTRPVVLEDVYRIEEDVVALAFSRSVADPSAETANFSVRVKNTVKNALGLPVEFDELIPVISVSGGEGNTDNEVYLKLESRLFSSDEVLVSYTPGGLETADGVAANGFTEQKLDFRLVNIAAEYGGFEDSGLGWLVDNVAGSGGTASFSTEKPRSGTFSAKLSSGRTADGTREWAEVITDGDEEDPTAFNVINVQEGNNYLISYWVFVEEATPVSDDEWEELSMFLWIIGDKLVVHEYRSSLTTHPIGEWVKIEAVWGGDSGAPSSGAVRPYFRTIGNVTAFFDDLEIYPYELRR